MEVDVTHRNKYFICRPKQAANGEDSGGRFVHKQMVANDTENRSMLLCVSQANCGRTRESALGGRGGR